MNNLASFDKTNLKSKKVKQFRDILIVLAIIYLIGFVCFIVLSLISENNPVTWERFTNLLNGMSYEFSLMKAIPLFQTSIIFLILTAFMVAIFRMVVPWQILRTLVLATGLLSLAYLFCAVLLLIIQSSLAHVIILSLLGIAFIYGFIHQSNILIYLKDRTFGDVLIEGFVAIGFIAFIGRMLIMAL